MNQTSNHYIDLGNEDSGTLSVHTFDATLHWLTTALCGLVCVALFVAWTVPVRQALVAMGI